MRWSFAVLEQQADKQGSKQKGGCRKHIHKECAGVLTEIGDTGFRVPKFFWLVL